LPAERTPSFDVLNNNSNPILPIAFGTEILFQLLVLSSQSASSSSGLNLAFRVNAFAAWRLYVVLVQA
jgi:hypothetical protein